MGLLDFTSKVLTEYKADISDHKAKVKELTGAQRDLAAEELKSAQARNKQIDDQISGLGKVAFAVGTAVAAIKVGQAGFEEYTKFQKLSAQVSSETLDKLKSASGGLRSEMDLLSFAAKTQHATFKLNADQQAVALQAMRALEKQGFDTEKVFEQVTKAVMEANGEGLKEFGISVDNGKDKAEAFKNVMTALSGEVRKVGGDLNQEGDDVRRMGVQWDDAMSKLKRAIGEIVVALGPLLSLVGDIAGAVGSVVGKLSSVVSTLLQPISLPGQASLGTIIAASLVRQQTADAMSQSAGADAVAANTGSYAFSSEVDPRVAARYAQASLVRWKKITEALKKAKAEAYGEATGAKIGGARSVGRIGGSVASDGLGAPGTFDLGVGSGINVGGFAFETSLGSGIRDDFGAPGGLQGLIDQRGADILSGQDGAAQAAGEQRQNKLERIFGPISDFNAYAAGFKLLEDAVTSAFSAWVSGSKSFAAAIKDAIKQGVMANAIDMFAQAIKHGAYALGSLAFGDARGAATHAAAAAKFAAGAVVLGGFAKALGGGDTGSSASTGGGAAPIAGASAANQNAPGRPITVILGDEYGAESPRRRQQRAALALEQARRVSDSEGIVYG